MTHPNPEQYTIGHRGDGVKKLKFPGALFANKYPTANFRVWQKGTYDTDNYSNGANVSIEPCFAFDHYTLGSLVVATVYAKDGDVPYAAVESGPHVPPLSLEMEDGILQDERTIQVIKTMAAQAVAARDAIYPVQIEKG